MSTAAATLVWKLFGVPAFFPRFADTRVITSGWDCARKGYDVLKTNPCDPWARPMNYPRLWTLPSHVGLGAGATAYVALAMIVAFLVATYFLMGRISVRMAIYYLLCLVSFPVLLLIERGNNDMLVFALLVATAGALAWLNRPGIGIAVALILLATALKLYPIAAAHALFLRLRGREQWLAVGVVGVAAIYALVTRQDLAFIQASTPRPAALGYGINVPIQALFGDLNGLAGGHLSHSIELVAIVLVLVGLVAATLWLARRLPPRRLEGRHPRETFVGLLFSLGASVYVLTFLLGNDWDYRLSLLLLTVPQMFAWSASPGLAREGRVGLVAVLTGLWLAEVSVYPVFFIVQLLLFALFVYFAAILLVTSLDHLDNRLIPRQIARWYAGRAA